MRASCLGVCFQLGSAVLKILHFCQSAVSLRQIATWWGRGGWEGQSDGGWGEHQCLRALLPTGDYLPNQLSQVGFSGSSSVHCRPSDASKGLIKNPLAWHRLVGASRGPESPVRLDVKKGRETAEGAVHVTQEPYPWMVEAGFTRFNAFQVPLSCQHLPIPTALGETISSHVPAETQCPLLHCAGLVAGRGPWFQPSCRGAGYSSQAPSSPPDTRPALCRVSSAPCPSVGPQRWRQPTVRVGEPL